MEDKAIIWETDEFYNIIKNYKILVDSDEYFKTIRFSTLTSIAISIYSDIKAGKIKDDNSCNNRLFLLYAVCETCKGIILTGKYSLNNIFNELRYNKIKSQYINSKDMSILKYDIEGIKKCLLNIENRDKKDKLHKLILKYDIMHDLVLNIIK